MDWSKAKNILILALIATNAFLLFTYCSKNQQGENITGQEAIFAALNRKNIYVDIEIPSKYEKMPAVTIEYNSDNEGLIEKNLKLGGYSVEEGASEEEYRKTADKFLRDCGIMSDNMKFDQVIVDHWNAVVIYKIAFREITIGDSFVEVTFENGKIVDVTRQMLTPVEQSKKKLKVISPEEALLIFMSEKKGEEAVHIEDMELVFWINDSSFDGEALVSDTAFPAWEITFNGGQKKYIEAYKV